MSLLPVTATVGGRSTAQKRKRYRALVVTGVILVVLTLYVDHQDVRLDQHDNHHDPQHDRQHDRQHVVDPTPRPLAHLTSLVVVACHSVYSSLDFKNPEDTSAWALLDYQKSTEGQTHSFLEHIMIGVEEAAKDDAALLLFSGGQTRKSAGPRAESMGYWMVAESMDWFDTGRRVRNRAFTEEHSRDSLENVVFSLCRFYELTGKYPEHLTIVSYEFKEQRFLDLHAASLGWPADKIRFVGTPALNPEMVDGEEKTRVLFQKDPYGCTTELREKRLARDPFANGPIDADRCPALEPAFAACARDERDLTKTLGKGALPWWNE